MLPDINISTGTLNFPKCGMCGGSILKNNHWQSINHPHGAWIHTWDAMGKFMQENSGLADNPGESAYGPHKAFPHDDRTQEQMDASDELSEYNYARDYGDVAKPEDIKPLEPKLGNIEPHMFGNPNLGGQFK